jgi:hypothetical protein
LRHPGLGPAAGVAPAAGQGGGKTPTARQGAPRRGAGSRSADPPGEGGAARRGQLAEGVEPLPAAGLGCMVCEGRSPPAAGPLLSDALCGGCSPRLRVGSRRPPGHGGPPAALHPVHPGHASRKAGAECVHAAPRSRASGDRPRDSRLSRMYPLLGQDAPGIRGPQAQDGRETSASVYASDLARVARQPPCAMARAVSDVRCATARLFPRVWDPWPLQNAGSGLCADRAGVALRAEPTPPHGPQTLAEVCGCRASSPAASHAQDHAHHLAAPGTAQ